jgi:hypothetical protein
MENPKGSSLLSPDAAITLVLGLAIGLIPDMDWWLRALGVLGTAILALHTARRLTSLRLKIGFPVGVVAFLLFGAWHPIWRGFHDAFPTVTEEDALAKIIEFAAIVVSGIAGFFFLLRPREKEGYRVLPAQVMAFGMCLVGAGFLTALIGLGWQFRQNWTNGTRPSGAPIFTVGPPQIAPTPPLPALPPPQGKASQTPFFSNYNLTEAGVGALADELYKVRDAIGKRVELDRLVTDGTAGGFISNFARACDQAGVECPFSNVHPNSPDEKGLMIYVKDPSKPPETAQVLRTVLLKLGIDVPFVVRPDFSTNGFSLFVGPRPPG